MLIELITKKLALLLLPCAAAAQNPDFTPTEHQGSLAVLQGDWIGSIEIAPDTSIRMAIQIIEKADGNLGANLASIDQGSPYIPDISVDIEGNELRLFAGTLGIEIHGVVSEDRTTIAATISQGGSSDPIVFRRVAALPEAGEGVTRLPAPPFPYASEDVRFENSDDGIWLAGTLDHPSGDARVPAVVFVSGSGPTQRDYSTSVAISDYLSRQGFAVLRYDKRGVFQSTGSYGEADEAAFARDAAAAVRYLSMRDGIDPSRIGFIGHSEGSQVAAQAVADYDADVAFLISMAGVGLNALDTLILQDGTESAAVGATADEVSVLRAFSRQFYATAMAVDGESEEARRQQLRALYDALEGAERETVFEWYGPYGQDTYSLNPFRASRDVFVAGLRAPSPAVYWRQVNVPVLVLNGGKDSQVPASQHVSGIMSALTHPESMSRVFPEMNHMFQTAETGAVEEYEQIEEPISQEVLIFIGDWLMSLD